MAIDNPQVNFQFAIEVNGIIQARIQKVTPPTVEYVEHKHGSAGNQPDKKTPGKKKVGDMMIENVVPGETGDPEIWLLFEAAGSGIRAAYIQNAFLLEFGVGGVAVGRFFLGEIWTKKIESSDYETREDNSADTIRTITWSVGDYFRV